MPLPAGEVLENELTAYGLHRFHVASGEALDKAAWMATIPWYARQHGDPVFVREWSEDLLGIYHLELCWKARDMFDVNKKLGGRYEPALLWWIGKAARLRDTIPEAIEAYLGYSGQIPVYLWLRSKNGAPDAYRDEVTDITVEIVTADWVPDKFLLLSRVLRKGGEIGQIG
jgi:hypothetical protein